MRSYPVILFWLFLAASNVAVGQIVSNYELGAGDTLSIRVFGEEELSLEEVQLDNGGSFSYPFLGEINANGKTAGEVENMIVQGLLGDYLVDPKVSVRILSYREFFVNGEVKQPGGYEFSPGLTIRKAVSRAGGFSEWASKTNITVIRESETGSEPAEANLDDKVMPGDIITINQSLF